MTFLLLLPVILGLLLLGAHLMHNLGPIWGLVSLGLMIVLSIPRPWVARLMQIVLIVAVLEWGRTAFVLVMEREDEGRPWMRLVIILGAVALFTAASTLVFFSRTLRRRYRIDGAAAGSQDGGRQLA